MNAKQNLEKLKVFKTIDLENIICFNLLKILKYPFFPILDFLNQYNGVNITAIYEFLNNPKYTEKKIKSRYINRLIDLELIENDQIEEKDDINKKKKKKIPLYRTSELGKKIVDLFHKFNFNLEELPDFTFFLRPIIKMILLSRLAQENRAINYEMIIKKFNDLGPRNKITRMLNYFVDKKCAEKRKPTKTYKISQLGKNIVDFYWTLYLFYVTEYEKGILGRSTRSNLYNIEFDPIWTNFDFSNLDTYTMFMLLNRVVFDNTQLKANLRQFSKIPSDKFNQLLSPLINLKILSEFPKNNIIGRGLNIEFYNNFKEISKNWNKSFE